WLLFGAVALVFWVGGNWWLNRHSMDVAWMTLVMVFGFVLLWLILFWHNAQIFPAVVGFDAVQHLNYLNYLQEHHSLPLPALPMQLYMSHYPTNETLAALLVSASLYFALRMAKGGAATWKSYCVLGLLIGAALLTKATAVLVVPFIVLALARQLTCQRASVTRWAGMLGSMLCIAILICAWHYIRISQYGSPLIGGSDPVIGVFWWQDDGYHTVSYFARFGESLVHPLFSATASFFDGLYSTLWGDGLCSGVSD